MDDEPATVLVAGPRVRVLFASRLAEQTALGLGSLWLARELGPDAFAPISVVYVLYSLSVTASDLGVGVGVLRLPPTQALASGLLRHVRIINGIVAVSTPEVALLLHGSARTIVLYSGPIWALSAESFIRRAAALKRPHGDRPVAASEIVGAGAFGVLVVLAGLHPEQAIHLVAVGFLGKMAAECCVGTPSDAFASNGDRGEVGFYWGTEVLAFVVANLDYLVIGFAFSPTLLALYVVAFRVVSAAPSQISYATGRVALVELSAAATPEARAAIYRRYVVRLAAIGGAAGLACAAASPLVAPVLGDSWKTTASVVVVLAVALPWRMSLGLTGSVMVTAGRARKLLSWDIGRIIVIAAALLAASRLSFAATVAMVVITEAAVGVWYHRGASRIAGFTAPKRLPLFFLVTAVVAGAASHWIGG